jgi:hypothetical protein
MTGMKHGDKLVYSPRTASVYFGQGDIAHRDFDNPMDFIGVKTIANMHAEEKSFVSSVDHLLKSAPSTAKFTEYNLDYVGSSKEGLKKIVYRKQLVAAIQEHGYTAKGMMAAQKLEQLDASIGGIGQGDIDPIRVVPLIKKILGQRPNIFFAEQGFFELNVEKLDARIPEQDTRTGQPQMSPLEKVDFDQLEFSEDKFSLKKNTHATLIPSETNKRADFNVSQLNSADAMISFARMRNGGALQALTAIDGTPHPTPGTSDYVINDPEATGSSAIPHGAFNVKKELLQQFQSHLDENESQITKTFWNPIDYARYESNYDVHGIDRGVNAITSGIVQLAGIPDVIAILDRAVPTGLIYAVDSQAALKANGPFETEFWREYSRDADAFVMRDYVQFKIPNAKRYGRKITIDATVDTSRLFVTGSEMDTDEKFEVYVRGKKGALLNKPAI